MDFVYQDFLRQYKSFFLTFEGEDTQGRLMTESSSPKLFPISANWDYD